MHRSSFVHVPLALVLAGVGACSLLNTPEDPRAGGGNGGGGGGPKGDCATADDCPRPTEPCRVSFCTADHKCEVQGAADGDICEDGEPCTSGELCAKGLCLGGTLTDCSADTNDCNKGVCTKGIGCGPVPLPEGTTCNAKNTCATSSCSKAGVCTVVALTEPRGAPCNDGLNCTLGDKCDENGVCVGGPPKCVKPSPCIDTVCDEANDKCTEVALADGAFCQDSKACTGGEICTSQTCGGGTKVKGFFSEDFAADNAKNWTLGAEWEIGPAKMSMDLGSGTDPVDDHTATMDNKIAGVVIGGDAANIPPHPMSYLESPSVDVADANGKLFLTFYRWLDSDYAPYMRNVVEVNDGTTWHEVWSSGLQSILDSPAAMPPGPGWTFQSLDITPYKNKALRFRFGFEVANNVIGDQPLSVGSWNLDDIKLQNAPCPN